MDRDELARLDAIAGRTRAEVAASDPGLLAKLRGNAGARRPGAPDGQPSTAGPGAAGPGATRPDGPPATRPERPPAATRPDPPAAPPVAPPTGPAAPGPNGPPRVPADETMVRPRVPLVSRDDVVNALPADAPLSVDPVVRDELVRARLDRLGAIAGLPAQHLERLAAQDNATPASLDDAALGKLVDDGDLPEQEAKDLGLTVSVYRLVDEDLALTERLRGAVAGMPNERVTSVRDLARLRSGDWRRLLDEAGSTPPVGLDRDEHAHLLAKRVEALYPTDALLARVLPDQASDPVRRFAADNDDLELLHLDYTVDSPDLGTVTFGGLDADQRRDVLSTVKGYQRIYALVPDADHAAKVLAAGYTSATGIVAGGYDAFLSRTKLSPETASQYYAGALKAVAATAAGAVSILDGVQGPFIQVAVGNTGPNILDFLRRIDGFEDLFGSQDFCDCAHCSSILGPGAYFVDLMQFVEEKLVDKVFTGPTRGHVLDLRTRRPDLWTLKVTCENTTTEIPQLVIVNEILENAIARRHGYTGPLEDRAAVHRAVYRDRIAVAVDSFRQPLLLPLERVRTYLRHFFDPARGGRSLGDIVRLLGAGPDAVAAAELGLSTREHELITRSNQDLGFLRRLYGIVFTPGAGGVVPPFDAQSMLAPIGVSRDELGALGSTAYVSARGGEPVTLVGKKSSANSVQNDVEHIEGLRLSSLDRLHRFVRLWRATGWTIGELDLTLYQLIQAGLATDLDAVAVRQVVRVAALTRRLGAPVEAVAVLYGALPAVPARRGDTALFDRVFNLPDFVRIDQRLPKDTVRYLHPSLADDPAAPVPHVHRRLLAGLRCGAADLAVLIRGLAGPLGADLTAPTESDRGFLLTVGNLSLLYRHARLAEWLRVSAAQLLRLIDLAPGVAGGHVGSLDELEALLAFHAWLRASGRSLDEVAFVAGMRVADPTRFPDPVAIAGRVVARIVGDAVASDAAAAAALPTYLAPELGVDAPTASALLAIAGVVVDEPLGAAARGTGPVTVLEQAIAAIARPAVLLDGLDADSVAFVAANPARFAITDLATPGVAEAQRVAQYRRFLRVEPATDTAAAALRRADLHGILGSATGLSTVDPAVLGRVLDAEATLVASVLARIHPAGDTLPALETLAECLDVAARLGIGGEELALLAGTTYDALDAAADALLAAFRAKYPDERQWQEKVRPFEERLLERRRDALVDHLVHSIRPEFTTREEIYRHYLIDVEVDGCFMTSRIVAAISSLQLYVHRVLMNLEQDQGGTIHVRPDLVPRDEWTWRANYRVWEANRKVFLWPENYLVPDLRDDKTPLFAELEAQLLQKEIDEQGVLDAYAAYLEGFRELAGLTIAGAYHDIDTVNEADVLHLIGVTPGDPLTYYHRTVTNAYHAEVLGTRGMVWSAWRKMDVKIPVRRVAPIVQDGRLSVFWTEVTTTPQNLVDDGESRFVGYSHRLSIKFTTLRLDGRWTAPQDIRLYGVPPFVESDGMLDDPLAEPEEWTDFMQAAFGSGFGIFANPNVSGMSSAMQALMTPRYDSQPHSRARDGYTLRGAEWEQLYPEPRWSSVFVAGVGFQLRSDVDLFAKQATNEPSIPVRRLALTFNTSPPSPVLCKNGPTLYYGTPSFAYFDDHAYAGLVADGAVMDRVFRGWEDTAKRTIALKDLYVGPVAGIGAGTLLPVNGSLTDGIVDVDGDLYLMQASVRVGARWLLRRLGTTLGEQIHRTLFADGVEGLLSLDTQRTLREAGRRVSLTAGRVDDAVVSGRLDFTGPFGTYYREIFFHIPFLIAHHLNSQGKYEQAQRWYQYIFDPTAAEVIADDPALSPAANAARKKDRNWRYLEFRGLDVPALRQILTDGQAIEAYHRDPFNPHAIARLRLSAYQKTIVMRYVDNLLDWADDLFTQFQMETVNQATMLYATAADILGDRPARLGDCGERTRTWSYEELKPALAAGSEFLVEVEHLTWLPKKPFATKQKINATYALDAVASTSATSRALGMASIKELGLTGERSTKRVAAAGAQGRAAGRAAVARPITGTDLAPLVPAVRVTAGPVPAAGETPTKSGIVDIAWNTAKGDRRVSRLDPTKALDMSMYVDKTTFGGYIGWGFVRQLVPAFCVPQNKELIGYWDRVADRLAKIRGCRDITGARRSLSLFAPEIDPMLLVRARAAGLSTQDVLGAVGAEVPPYRFSYLIEKAKQFTAAVQGFGAALQAALERKDAEELTQLRNTHQRNLLVLSTSVREWDRDAAAASLDSLRSRKSTVEHRRDYYQNLINTGLVAEEWAQRVFRHLATGGKSLEATFGFLSGALNLLPQIGSPFAMKYGGMEVGNSAHRFAVGTRALSDLSDTLAASASLEAGFVRRDEGWRQQAQAANDELVELEKQLTVAQLRYDIAAQSVAVHEETLKQTDEIAAYYADRFTELGLYTYLSTTLQGLHRTAYNAAHALARMAERSLRYERDDLDLTPIGNDHWDASRAGLLAGARLMVALQAMEQRYITANHRTLEVDQSFSLTQIDPAALVRLKETGECEFTLPEVAFDLVYPGHYRRRIKAVRLTIPCVTGPYANVAATLTLVSHWLRREPGLSDTGLAEEPLGRTTTVATSSAQNDAGVFELNFREERYLPFEGGGAVSRWRLTLPKSFRQFDYQSINDTILRMSYTAHTDEAFRADVEEVNATVAGTIAQVLTDEGMSRVVSLRQDSSVAFNRLLHSPAGTPVTVELGAGQLPYFLHGRALRVSRALLVLRTAAGIDLATTTLHIGPSGVDTPVMATGFAAEAELGDLPVVEVTAAFGAGVSGRYELTVVDAGALAPDPAVPGDPSAVDAAKLADVLLYLEYSLG